MCRSGHRLHTIIGRKHAYLKRKYTLEWSGVSNSPFDICLLLHYIALSRYFPDDFTSLIEL